VLVAVEDEVPTVRDDREPVLPETSVRPVTFMSSFVPS
jgi:hypothetical protein